MNPVVKVIEDIKFAIPAEILQVAFYRREFGQFIRPVTVDDLIRERVIEGRVRPDCDLVGGTEITIPIHDLTYEIWDTYRYCYRIPRERTNGRQITRTVGVIIGSNYYSGGMYMGVEGYSQTLDASNGVLASLSAIPHVASADVQLVGPNTILVSDILTTTSMLFLRCYVENDADFNNLRSTVVQRFSEMCLLATKAYIYNKLKVPMDMGELIGGQPLGAFKEIVDGYSDAREQYQDFLLNKWKRIAIFNDPMAKRRHLRLLMGGHR